MFQGFYSVTVSYLDHVKSSDLQTVRFCLTPVYYTIFKKFYLNNLLGILTDSNFYLINTVSEWKILVENLFI